MRATKVNLQNEIIEAIKVASAEALKKTGVHIRKLPEYFLNVFIVNELTEKFDTLGYRLEMPVKAVLTSLGVEVVNSPLDIRDSGNFDIVLTSRKSGAIRHVVEVKRSLSNRQLVKEAKRLKALALEKHESKRLQTGFIATVSRLKHSTRSLDLDKLLDKRLDTINEVLDNLAKVSCRYELLESGDYGFDQNESLLITVFCIEKS
jgi:hypothetical protein